MSKKDRYFSLLTVEDKKWCDELDRFSWICDPSVSKKCYRLKEFCAPFDCKIENRWPIYSTIWKDCLTFDWDKYVPYWRQMIDIGSKKEDVSSQGALVDIDKKEADSGSWSITFLFFASVCALWVLGRNKKSDVTSHEFNAKIHAQKNIHQESIVQSQSKPPKKKLEGGKINETPWTKKADRFSIEQWMVADSENSISKQTAKKALDKPETNVLNPKKPQNQNKWSGDSFETIPNEVERKKRSVQSRKFDLAIFDLDETLLPTSDLERFRGKENTRMTAPNPFYESELRRSVIWKKNLVGAEILHRMIEENPGIKMCIFTKSPKRYVGILLETFYPDIAWDCIIAFEDVRNTKPDPEWIRVSMSKTGVSDPAKVVFFWDSRDDVAAAYQAGAYSALCRYWWELWWESRKNDARRDHYNALDLMADAVVNSPRDILTILSNPTFHLPLIEGGEIASANGLHDREPVRKFHPDRTVKEFVFVKSLWRYFSSHSNRYDFSQKARIHGATRHILNAKDWLPYPDEWVRRVAETIKKIAKENSPVIVAPIPARPWRKWRMEEFVGAVESSCSDCLNARFEPGLLRYKTGVKSNHGDLLNSVERFENIRKHLEIPDPSIARMKTVILIDDVTTTGATFYYAKKYLMAKGAKKVECISLTHTIS